MDGLSLNSLIETAIKNKKNISDIFIELQMKELNLSYDEIYAKMKIQYEVMVDSIKKSEKMKSEAKIEEKDISKKYNNYIKKNKSIIGDVLSKASMRSIAVAEYNASMGRILASPTAGSSGIMPGSIITIKEFYNIEEEKVIKALFTAGAIGMVIANSVSIAGATAGCQAECGTAQAMSAGAIVEMLSGNPMQVGNAVALTLKSIMGLVCDPVAGLVECPCIKRNGQGSINSIYNADIALAGITSIIPVDEVIYAMKEVGELMDSSLKETACGGLANTNTGIKLRKKIFGK